MTEKLPSAQYGAPDRPLRIADLEIPCYVLEDGRRVLVQRGMVTALGMSRGSSGGTGGDRLAKFAAGKGLKDFISGDLAAVTGKPILFRAPNGAEAYGYEATVLADLCEAVLAARDAGKLQDQQLHIAKQCEILVRGFARVGIIALVDSATGYEKVRARDDLEKILRDFVTTELRKWLKTFPDEFYQEMFRLNRWPFTPGSVRRPGVVGRWTTDIVYDRLAPGVRAELKRLTPRDDKGRLRHHLHRHLTEDIGHPRLREHLSAVVALMKAAPDWRRFQSMLNRALPRYGDTMELGLDDPG
jgi:P63C domain-containing protein